MWRNDVIKTIPQIGDECITYMINQLDVADKRLVFAKDIKNNTLAKRVFDLITGNGILELSLMHETLNSQISSITKFIIEIQKDINIGFNSVLNISNKIYQLENNLNQIAVFAESTYLDLQDFKKSVDFRFKDIELNINALKIETLAKDQLNELIKSWDADYFKNLSFAETIFIILDNLKRGYFGAFLASETFSSNKKSELKESVFKEFIKKRKKYLGDNANLNDFLEIPRSHEFLRNEISLCIAFLGLNIDSNLKPYTTIISQYTYIKDVYNYDKISKMIDIDNFIKILMIECLDG